MNAKLCDPVPSEFASAADKDAFFDESEKAFLRGFEKSELSAAENATTCSENMYLGFFFDGTKNNYVQAEEVKSHSNVVRLYDCFPGNSVPGVLPGRMDWTYRRDSFSHFFRTYIPGVASPFEQIGDSGKGLQLTFGAATGYLGQDRIAWALVQALNNVHRYFLKTPLVTPEEQYKLARSLDLSKFHREFMGDMDDFSTDGYEPRRATRDELAKLLRKLHAALRQHWHAPGQRPSKIDPGIVETIHVSVFGFSRGATQARAFSNWLLSLCALDAALCGKPGPTLGGFPVKFDFLGLFDTVASVGPGNTFGNKWWGHFMDGHGAWADAESNLRIPAGVPCLHLVAAHEIRRSFPCDSISVKGVLPDNCQEIVIPGVHSDVGGGYCIFEQGRGIESDGADMLARIPLITMYKAARLAGVPLKLEWATAVAQDRFKVSRSLIDDINAYLNECKVKSGRLTDIMREQAELRMLYQKARRVSGKSPVTSAESFNRASNFDKNDLESAYLELEDEIASFESAIKSGTIKPAAEPVEMGFHDNKPDEWREIARWWASGPAPSQAVLKLFDNYVHDSRAWFKLSIKEKDNEPEVIAQLEEWSKQAEVAERNAKLRGEEPYYSFGKDKLAAVKEYAKTRKLPRMRNAGREDWEMAGYLRYRKVYAGGDRLLISKLMKEEARIRMLAKTGPTRTEEVQTT